MVPTERMEETVNTVHPRLVILSAQTLITAVSLREMARLLEKRGVQTAFGGRVFNHISGLSSRMPAHFLGSTIEAGLSTIESLINNPAPSPAEEAIDQRMLQIAAEYKQKRPHIESLLLDELNSRSQTTEHLETANHFLGSTLAAALELGDISYLSTDINWLTNLLIEQKVSVSVLPTFLSAYAQATREAMGDTGEPIVESLSLEAQKLRS